MDPSRRNPERTLEQQALFLTKFAGAPPKARRGVRIGAARANLALNRPPHARVGPCRAILKW